MATFNNFIRNLKQINYSVAISKSMGFQTHSVGYVCPPGRIALVSVVSTSSIPTDTTTQGFVPSTAFDVFGRSLCYMFHLFGYNGFLVLKGGEELKYFAFNPQRAPTIDETASGVVSIIEIDSNQSLAGF